MYRYMKICITVLWLVLLGINRTDLFQEMAEWGNAEWLPNEKFSPRKTVRRRSFLYGVRNMVCNVFLGVSQHFILVY